VDDGVKAGVARSGQKPHTYY